MNAVGRLAEWPCQKYNPPHDCGRITGDAPLPCGPCTARAILASPAMDVETFARAMHLARLMPDRVEPYCDNPLTGADLAEHMRWAEAILYAARMLPPYVDLAPDNEVAGLRGIGPAESAE